MPRERTGEIRSYTSVEGVTTYSIRFRANGKRHSVRLGTSEDGWTRKRAERELQNTLVLVEKGLWEPPAPTPADEREEPTFHVVASRWLAAKELELSERGLGYYRWGLEGHLLPFFARYRPSEITLALVERYKQHKQLEAKQIVEAREAGAVLRDGEGRPLRALSNASINKTLEQLATILDKAFKQYGIERPNPARDRDLRLKVHKRRRSFLEPDELMALVEAAGEIDDPEGDETRLAKIARVRELRANGTPWRTIGAELGVAESTAIYYHHLAVPDGRAVPRPRRAIVATFGGAGLRATELCELDGADVDLAHGRLKVRDAKTPAGIREVDMTDWVREELLAYVSAIGGVRPDAPFFPTRTGRRRTKDNLNERVIGPAVRHADRRRREQGLPPLPRITNHSLRRTYISLLFAARAEPPYVMAQVGHEDARTTLQIYAQVLKSRQRKEVGEAFDRLIRGAARPPAMTKLSRELAGEDAPTTSSR